MADLELLCESLRFPHSIVLNLDTLIVHVVRWVGPTNAMMNICEPRAERASGLKRVYPFNNGRCVCMRTYPCFCHETLRW